MSGEGAQLAEAEADAFWCLAQLMTELHDSITERSLAVRARNIQTLLRAYDAPVADLLQKHGQTALPAMRLGVALCTRAGFKLADCARIWDSLLADPKRFDLCDYVVIAP